jgi:hypothetical protein
VKSPRVNKLLNTLQHLLGIQIVNRHAKDRYRVSHYKLSIGCP